MFRISKPSDSGRPAMQSAKDKCVTDVQWERRLAAMYCDVSEVYDLSPRDRDVTDFRRVGRGVVLVASRDSWIDDRRESMEDVLSRWQRGPGRDRDTVVVVEEGEGLLAWKADMAGRRPIWGS